MVRKEKQIPWEIERVFLSNGPSLQKLVESLLRKELNYDETGEVNEDKGSNLLQSLQRG